MAVAHFGLLLAVLLPLWNECSAVNVKSQREVIAKREDPHPTCSWSAELLPLTAVPSHYSLDIATDVLHAPYNVTGS
jgi:hypothetical protein